MHNGKQIKIYLADGTPTGVRHAEIVGWTGQAVAIPRSKLKEVSEFNEELQKPGVYFLFGIDEESGNDAVYIGETEQLAERIEQHTGKDFWKEAVGFTNKDQNFTKAHVKYLESRLQALAENAKRYDVIKGKSSTEATLPRGDIAAMNEFIANMRILIGALGYRVLEPLIHSVEHSVDTEVHQDDSELLILIRRKYTAKARLTDEGFVVLAGSEGALSDTESLSKGNRKTRNTLIEKGILKPTKEKLIMQQDWLFSSPSQAASVILGYPCNGLDYWKNADGLTLKQLEQ